MTWPRLVPGLGGLSNRGIVSFPDSDDFEIVFWSRMVSGTTLRLFRLFRLKLILIWFFMTAVFTS